MNLGLLLLIHGAATWFLTGVIWTIQAVHYPLFARVGESGYREYQRSHQRLIAFVVGPSMLLELLASVLLVVERHDFFSTIGLALLGVIWCSTAFLQVPLHTALSNGFDPNIHARLVRTNWIRTVGWTARALLALYLLRATA